MSGVLRERLLEASSSQLYAALASGHAIDTSALDDVMYRGISLNLPGPIESLTWKTFRKCFHRDSARGVLRGWNVRLEQTGLDGVSRPMTKDGHELSFGHYEVVPLDGYRIPRRAVSRGLLLDYGKGGNARLDPTNRVRDPIVALVEGSADVLLGWTYLDLGLTTTTTPSFFLLEREGPLDVVVPRPGS